MKKIILLGWFAISINQLCAQAFAQGSVEGLPVSYEYSKRIKTGSPEALSQGLFGEQVSQYDGSTYFSVTDIDVPGNNTLPIRLTRRFSVEGRPVLVTNYDARYGGVGDWSIEVPYIGSTYPVGTGGYPTQLRCSGGAVPSMIIAGLLRPEFWAGIDLNIPGRGETKLLSMTATSSVPRPIDGVSRNYTTSERDAIDCIPMKSGFAGQGYRVTTTGGVRYYFDIETIRKDAPIETRKYIPPGIDRMVGDVIEGSVLTVDSGGGFYIPVIVQRNRYYLLPSRVEDRFGNAVTYEYNTAGHPTRIASSDGREINLIYQSQRLVSASSHGKVWAYTYLTSGPEPLLKTAAQPDGSLWEYSQTGTLRPEASQDDGLYLPECGFTPQLGGDFQLSVKHPSGASGKFNFLDTRHFRSGVHVSECVRKGGIPEITYALVAPNYYDIFSITKKSISGSGISGSQDWSYDFQIGDHYQGRWGNQTTAFTYPCTTCATSKTTKLTNPDGSRAVYTYGILYKSNEGRFLGVDAQAASGALLSSERNQYVTDAQVAQSGFFGEYGLLLGGVGNPVSTMVRPLMKREVVQQDVNFVSTINSFDTFARATNITDSSSLGYSKTDAIAYHDDLTKWVLGQVKTVTNANTNQVVSQTNYDAATALPLQSYRFGLLQNTMSYNLDGTLATVKDAKNNTTSLSNYKRGIPQTIGFADGTSISGVVNDSGWVSSITDQLGSATNYQYDAMGRLSAILYPTGDTNAWNATSISFQQINSVEHGLPAGHWRQSIYQGNKHTNKYLDALWRPVMVEELDATNIGNTVRQTINKYDSMGRQVFQSYPIVWVDDFNTVTVGTTTEYDALGRVTKVKQDSELGQLTTTTEYLAGFQTKVTNPKGVVTRQGYQVFDAPDTSRPVFTVYAEGTPESKISDVIRDVFGKATYTQMRNPSASQYLGRSYVFDANERLCKTVVPEQGATHYEYDANSNVVRTTEGDHTNTSRACDAGNVDISNKIINTYDAMNRITNIDVPFGNNGDKSYVYAGDGLVTQINTVSNTAPIVNRYFYNKRRLLTNEHSEQTGWYTWGMAYAYNDNAALSRISYPTGFYVDYVPNGLGQATQAASVHGNWANTISYYPNGAVKQFTYGNGIVHTMAQNARQLPSATTDSKNGVNITGGEYTFDGNGNNTYFWDYSNPSRLSRSMAYDALDRLTQANSALWNGYANYQYDALDNLKRSTLGLAGFTYNYDANNRLSRVDRDAGGSYNYTYDGKGNVTHNGRNWFTYDGANRMVDAVGVEGYRYDGNNRRVLAWAPAGGGIISMYGQDGTLYYQNNDRETQNYEYIYLNGDPIAFRNYNWANGFPNATLKTRYQHTDALGSPVATTDEAGNVVDRTEYAPYGAPLNRPVSGVGYTGHVMDQNTGLVYAQQRYYDPMLGRFLSADPVSTNPNNGGNFNRYWYANNNPYKFTDPDGRKAGCARGTCDGNDGTSRKHPATAEELQSVATTVGMVFMTLPSIADSFAEGGSSAEVVFGAEVAALIETELPATEAVVGGGAVSRSTSTIARAQKPSGSIYRVPGTATRSGKPYIGRHNKPNPAESRRSNDGRDRTQAKVVDTYDVSKKQEGRLKEQQHIDAEGLENLDNKRNEIRKK